MYWAGNYIHAQVDSIQSGINLEYIPTYYLYPIISGYFHYKTLPTGLRQEYLHISIPNLYILYQCAG